MAGTGIRVVLLLLSLLGFWTLWVFPYNNGLLRMLGALSDPGASVPGTIGVAIRQRYTGVGVLDKQITTLVGFFYTAIDVQRIDIALTFLNLGSQVLAAWILITIESLRVGNQGNFLVTSTTLFGLAVALIGYACVAPIYFFVHLTTAKTASNPRYFNIITQLPFKLAIVPFAAVIGFGVPSVLMTLPAPSVLSYRAKQTWTALQQGWSIWIHMAQSVLELIAVKTNSMLTIRTGKQKQEESVKYARRAYISALAASASAHLLYTGLGLTAAFAPGLLSPKLQTQLRPANYFLPPNPFNEMKARTLADGALWFLQWDLIIGVLSTMIWGIAVKLSAASKQDSVSSWTSALIEYGLIAVFVGPAGAAVVAIWRRDVAVISEKRD